MAQSCDPQALANASTCFHCLPDPKAVKTYLLCQWASKPVGPSCTVPTPVITNVQPVGAPDGFSLVWTSSRDPLLEFLIYFGQNPGGPYNDPQSPITIAPNLRSTVVNGLITGNTYYIIVVAVDSLSPECRASSLETNIDLTA